MVFGSTAAARRRGLPLLAAAVAALLVGCGQTTLEPGSYSVPSPALTPAGTPSSTAPDQADDADEPAANDLAKGTARRVVRSDGMVFTLTYSSGGKTTKWRADRLKPLRVTLSVGDLDDSKQKVYVSRATLNVVASDANGPIDTPKALTDTAGISPGYLVSFPYTYEQNFLLPAVDSASRELAVTVNFELLFQVSGAKGTKDYAKQTLSDELSVPVS